MAWGWIAAAIGAAFVFACSTQLKHLSSRDVPAAHTLRPGAVRALVAATVRHRYWLLGIGCDVVGLGLQIIALHLGPLVSVQAVLVLSLVFALVFRQLHQRRFRPVETSGALLVTAALAGLILLAHLRQGLGSALDPGPALGAGVTLLVVLACTSLVGRRHEPGARLAVLLGITVGSTYATTAALLKQISNIGVHDPVGIVTSWPLYVVVPLGLAGLVLSQIAFRSGPLSASLPAMSVADPLLSIVLGIAVFDERIRSGFVTGFGLGALLLVLVLGVIWLARSNITERAGWSS